MTRRIFVALPIPVFPPLQFCMQGLKHRAELVGFKWVPEANYHVTLRYLGVTPEVQLHRLMELLANELVVAPFTLGVEGLGCFVKNGSSGVFWAGVMHSSVLEILWMQVNQIVGRAGWANNEYPYQPHLTLARWSNLDSKVIESYLAKISEREWGSVLVDQLVVYESCSSPSGVIYKPLRKIALANK